MQTQAMKDNVHKLVTRATVHRMYASSLLRCVHGVGISRTKNNSMADLICATLLMP